MENEMKEFSSQHQPKKFIFGILILTAGVLLLATNFGWIQPEFKNVIFSWPMILIIIGIFQVGHRNYFPAFIFFGIGFFFLLPELAKLYPQAFPGITSNFSAAYWPVLLIFAGVFILLQFIFPNKCCKFGGSNQWHNRWNEKKWERFEPEGASPASLNDAGFEKNVVFGSVEHIFLDEIFPSGEINAVFGGITLDLRKTKLAEGDTYLVVNTVFGGITLFIPSEWYVVSKFDGVFGGFADKRLPQEPTDKTRRLIIKGSCVFGGGEIR